MQLCNDLALSLFLPFYGTGCKIIESCMIESSKDALAIILCDYRGKDHPPRSRYHIIIDINVDYIVEKIFVLCCEFTL